MAALILMIRKITIYQSFVKYIRAGCAEVEDLDRLEQFGRLVEQSGVKTAVELTTNHLISSPLLIGFFHPCIVLPTERLTESEFQYTILHELTHYKRRDMFYKWLVQLTLCVHWFNPLVYLMGREVERACELSCDEAVIRGLDPQGRRAYGDTPAQRDRQRRRLQKRHRLRDPGREQGQAGGAAGRHQGLPEADPICGFPHCRADDRPLLWSGRGGRLQLSVVRAGNRFGGKAADHRAFDPDDKGIHAGGIERSEDC